MFLPTISVIIPVYNTEKYLHRCIDSILAQIYIDFELLLINDGSMDRSGDICNEYAQKDTRIKVFHKENSGVSSTRNIGLDNAKGKYIIFIDADDYWCDNMALEKFVDIAERYDLDIVRGDYKEIGINDELIRKAGEKRIDNKVVDSLCFLRDIVCGEYFLWLCLIKTSAIRDLRFNPQRVFLEDAEFYLKMLQHPLKCMYIPRCFYAYRKHNEAISVKVHPQKFFDALDYSRLCFNLAKLNSCKKDFVIFLVNEGIRNYLYDIKVVSETDRTNTEYDEVINKYGLYQLRKDVILMARNNLISIKYYLCFLPLKMLIYYYRKQFDIKRSVKNIIKRLA